MTKRKVIGFCLAIVGVAFTACKDEVDLEIQASFQQENLPKTAEFIDTQVVNAYAMLDGNLLGGDPWYSAASNWIYGEVASDNAYKGSEPGDQGVISEVEIAAVNANNLTIQEKWRAVYEGVNRTNVVILAVQQGLEQGTISEEDAALALGEARFLRGHYHFEAKKIWNMVPFVDENAEESIPNDKDIWPDIEADFQFAVDNLSDGAQRPAGANKWNSMAYLAKAHMYQLDYDSAKPLLDRIINEGPYDLQPNFSDNFNANTIDGIEAVFSILYATQDGAADEGNSNKGDALNFPHGDTPVSGCCGFFQPSHNLVNAFKTDGSGLPLFDSYDNEDIVNVGPNSDERVEDDDNFVAETGPLDPRLDWTVGRKSIPYLGHGDYAGLSWVRDPGNGGPYMGKKHVYKAGDAEQANASWTSGFTAVPTNVIRFAEILLWRAEIAANEGDLATALDLVNRVRARAANPDGFVKRDDGSDAANYEISTYTNFPSQEFAIDAVAFEYRLETAMEGHRFFDLVRRNQAVEVLSAYLADEDQRPYLRPIETFSQDARYYPIPANIISLSNGVVSQR